MGVLQSLLYKEWRGHCIAAGGGFIAIPVCWYECKIVTLRHAVL